MSEWNRELGLSDTGIHTRLKNGWTIEEILSTPKIKSEQQLRDETRAAVAEKEKGSHLESSEWELTG